MVYGIFINLGVLGSLGLLGCCRIHRILVRVYQVVERGVVQLMT